MSTASLLDCAKTDVTLPRVRALVAQERSESLTLEYKERYSQSLVKSVAAMANTYGGLIVVGVCDSATGDRIVGVSSAVVEQIVNGCFNSLEPPVEPELIELPLPDADGKSIVVVRVHTDRVSRPVLMDGCAPIRLHGRNAIADRSRLQQLFAEPSARTPVAASLRPPQLDERQLFTLRSGMRMPVGNATAWRALSEGESLALGSALDTSAIQKVMEPWYTTMDLPAPRAWALGGHNRARWMRLVSGAITAERGLHAAVEVRLPDVYGAANGDLLCILDVVVRHGADSSMFSEDDSWVQVGVPRLRELIDAMLLTLASHDVVKALAALADIDQMMVPRPRSMHLVTKRELFAVLDHPQLERIIGAGTSYGADMVADPALNPADPVQRHEQVTRWLEQVALDAGVSGMQRLLTQLPRLSRN